MKAYFLLILLPLIIYSKSIADDGNGAISVEVTDDGYEIDTTIGTPDTGPLYSGSTTITMSDNESGVAYITNTNSRNIDGEGRSATITKGDNGDNDVVYTVDRGDHGSTTTVEVTAPADGRKEYKVNDNTSIAVTQASDGSTTVKNEIKSNTITFDEYGNIIGIRGDNYTVTTSEGGARKVGGSMTITKNTDGNTATFGNQGGVLSMSAVDADGNSLVSGTQVRVRSDGDTTSISTDWGRTVTLTQDGEGNVSSASLGAFTHDFNNTPTYIKANEAAKVMIGKQMKSRR